MIPMSIIGMFCEDIREEKNDIITLVGLMPDNVRYRVEVSDKKAQKLSADQNIWNARICIYSRANFDTDDPIEKIELRLILPNDDELEIGGASADVIQQAKEQAKERGGPLAGVVMRAMLQGFRLSEPGILRLEAIMGTDRRLLAFLNFQEIRDSDVTTA
ncbi:MAG: hypothetical protein O2807_13475 [bacterium]|nr:hypothetical protein [bacterium]